MSAWQKKNQDQVKRLWQYANELGLQQVTSTDIVDALGYGSINAATAAYRRWCRQGLEPPPIQLRLGKQTRADQEEIARSIELEDNRNKYTEEVRSGIPVLGERSFKIPDTNLAVYMVR